ncbi:hypothetical protein GQX73_g1960 [Xylaria multiplex]|uniref:RBR-type E3 ubiquitin transferase n=1 Tax=Xylaria multiplex TaxID=323545 RepID=A0A7C8IT03_9PEZI|nr:hypothetical protein GQX73_g1960 [Xylaria multiplex]
MLIIDQEPSDSEELSEVRDFSIQRYEDQDITGVDEKGKGKAVARDVTEDVPLIERSSDELTVDWKQYEPPEGLRYVEDRHSETVVQIVEQSIERVKARIREEEEERNAVAGKETQRQKEIAGKEEGKMEQSKGVEDRSDGDSTEIDKSSKSSSTDEGASGANDARPFPTELPKRPGGRTLLNFFRKFNGGPEHGESSAAGAARPRFLISSPGELLSHSARKRFVSDLIKKATGEDISAQQGPEFEESEDLDGDIEWVECVSCLEDFNAKRTVRVPCHNYCVPCFRRLVVSACQNEQHWPPKCCLNNIPDSTIRAGVDKLQWLEYRERAIEWNCPVADRIYCSQQECSQFIRPEYIIPGRAVARCSDGHHTCIICRNEQHGDEVCPQDEDMIRTNALAEAAGWKRCNACRAYVEHSDGCQHMTCRCGAQFCYVCGARWRTCSCTPTHLAIFKQQAESRRTERLEREAREEAEIQEALRLVQEFEREEEERAQALREKERRLARERRQKRKEERIRRAVTRFEGLREVFAELYATQHAMVQQSQERREWQLETKGDAVRRRMRDMHEAERETQRAKVEAKIAMREGALRTEYMARVVEERQIEEAYEVKLRAFWDRRGGGDKKFEIAMTHFRRRMDVCFEAWKKSTGSELELYIHAVREEFAIREELMDEKERRLEARTREVALSLAMRRTAELRWVREVFEERGRLLDELEAAEMWKLQDVDVEAPEGALGD